MVEKLQKKAKKPKIVIVDDDYRQVPQPIAQPQNPPRHIPPRDQKTGCFIKKHIKDAQPPVQLQKHPKMQQPIGKKNQLEDHHKDHHCHLHNKSMSQDPITFTISTMTFQTENESLLKFKSINICNSQNKNFKSFTNEFKVKIFKKLDDVIEIYHIFQELIKTVKRRRKLSDNDRLRLVIQNEHLPNAISTKFNKVKDFKVGDLEQVIRILEYKNVP